MLSFIQIWSIYTHLEALYSLSKVNLLDTAILSKFKWYIKIWLLWQFKFFSSVLILPKVIIYLLIFNTWEQFFVLFL